MSLFRYQLATEKSLIYQATPGVIDGLSPPKETGHYIYCAAR